MRSCSIMMLMLGVYGALSRTGSVALSSRLFIFIERVEVTRGDIDDEVVGRQPHFVLRAERKDLAC
jgi:hypothetical protein